MASSQSTDNDEDGDGRPDGFELDQDLDGTENDVEWTFLVYCCGDDIPRGDKVGTLLPEMWEFIEKLSWVGCTDDITIVVQFDGSDQLNGYHQDMFWNDIPNNKIKDPIEGTSTRRFLVGKDSTGWDPSLSLQADCTNNTLVDLYDVTDWDPKNTGKAHDSLQWEANMADPLTFFEFLSWGMDTFPSDNYCLYVDSHGDGIHGFGYDFRPNSEPTTLTKDVISLEDIGTTADLMMGEDPPKKLDMVMLQSCLMGNIESCYEFSRFSDYYISSENVMHLTGNQDDKVLKQLEENPSWSPSRLAREFIDIEYKYSRDGMSNPPWNIMDWDGKEKLTFSCLNNTYMSKTDIIEMIKGMNSALVRGAEQDPGFYVTNLRESISESSTDHYTNEFDYIQIDYYHFLQYWVEVEGPQDGTFPIIKDLSDGISRLLWNMDLCNRGIEYEKHDYSYFYRTRGISIYLPFSPIEWGSANSKYSNLSFEEDTGWGAVIDIIHKNHPPVVEPVEVLRSYPGEYVFYTFNATDLNGDLIDMTVEWTDAPFDISDLAYLSISYTATESQAGLYNARLKFDDRNGSYSTTEMRIEIMPFNIPPEIEAVPPQTAFVGEEFSYRLSISDDNPGDELNLWCIYSGTGESWIDDDQILRILPFKDDIGVQTVKVWLSDNNGSRANISFPLTVGLRNHPPLGPELLEYRIEAGDRDTQRAVFIDSDGDTLNVDEGSWNPDWLDISMINGLACCPPHVAYDLVLDIHPDNNDLGSWEFTLEVVDGRGGLSEVVIKIEVVGSPPPLLKLSDEIILGEREEHSFLLETDYDRNGTIIYEIRSGARDFITLDGDVLKLAPVDGDKGTCTLVINTMIVGGSFSQSDHIVHVERNLSTLEVGMEVFPMKESYQIGDRIHVEVSYSGYGADLEFLISLTQNGEMIDQASGTDAFFILPDLSEFKVTVSLEGQELEIDPISVHVAEKETIEEGGSISPFVFIPSIVLVFLGASAAVSFFFLKRKMKRSGIEGTCYSGPNK
ncbi:MAG: clostripain-related cysteine peptidase [Thermoplasmatota archaeon]